MTDYRHRNGVAPARGRVWVGAACLRNLSNAVHLRVRLMYGYTDCPGEVGAGYSAHVPGDCGEVRAKGLCVLAAKESG